MLKFTVKGQTLMRVDGFKVVGDSRNYLKAKFTFSDDWAEAEPKLASFRRVDGSGPGIQVELDENGECLVPWEALTGSGTMEVSIAAGDLITANAVNITVYKAGETGLLDPTEASPGLLKKLMAAIDALKDLVGELPEDAEADTVIEYISEAVKKAVGDLFSDDKTAEIVQKAVESCLSEITAEEVEKMF